MGVELSPRPLIAFQGKGPRCWAGATTSWLTVNKERPQLNLQALVDRYGNPNKGGSISFQDENWIKLQNDMRWQTTSVMQPTAKNGITFFKLIEDGLIKYGYLIFIINQKDGVSHAVTCFGIRTIAGLGAVLMVMDPAKGDYDFMRIEFLFGSNMVGLRTSERLSQARKPQPTFIRHEDGPPIKDN